MPVYGYTLNLWRRKMAAAKRTMSTTGQTIPNWKIIDPEMKPTVIDGQKRSYARVLADACYYIHTEIDNKKLQAEFVLYCEKHFDKAKAKTLKKLKDYQFGAIGKYTYILAQGGQLDANTLDKIEEHFNRLVEQALLIVEEEQEVADKPKTKVISIQDRMREQVSDMLGVWEGNLDDWFDNQFDLKKFDPYKDMMTHQPEIKPAHAKIIQDAFAPMLAEARAVVAWEDEDIKESYSFFTARATERKKFLNFFEAIHTATDTIINTGKATRKTRAKKAPSKDKLIAKIKYKESESSLGLASIHPVSILGASQLWVYNTKNRKLMKFIADDMLKTLSVKGTTVIGFDPVKSTQKTIRKPELLKGVSKLARTKFDKLYSELSTTETACNGRMNEHCILIKVF